MDAGRVPVACPSSQSSQRAASFSACVPNTACQTSLSVAAGLQPGRVAHVDAAGRQPNRATVEVNRFLHWVGHRRILALFAVGVVASIYPTNRVGYSLAGVRT
jgi:hypothetical protein